MQQLMIFHCYCCYFANVSCPHNVRKQTIRESSYGKTLNWEKTFDLVLVTVYLNVNIC